MLENTTHEKEAKATRKNRLRRTVNADYYRRRISVYLFSYCFIERIKVIL